jgi:hypothetical protein
MDRSRRLLTALALCGVATLGAQHLEVEPVAAAPAAPSAVRPGAFCRASEAGRVDRAADGRWMRCEITARDARHRWREVIK